MPKKTAKYSQDGIDDLPNDKPVLYRIKTQNGNTNYAGIAKRGRVRDRINEHLGEIPGTKVQIEQFSSIKDAQKKEVGVIKQSKPKYNDKGK
ncbi:hypothetical protein BMS3Abin10_00214 [bacterium BMS3Abin10]|nr:hypothetical protein BMS3Abin10_00214 [bacterium BMS3Abin10]